MPYLIHIPIYKVKTFAFFATFCGGKKLNKKLSNLQIFTIFLKYKVIVLLFTKHI